MCLVIQDEMQKSFPHSVYLRSQSDIQFCIENKEAPGQPEIRESLEVMGESSTEDLTWLVNNAGSGGSGGCDVFLVVVLSLDFQDG